MVHYVSIAGLSIVPREAFGVPKGLEPQTMLFFTIQAGEHGDHSWVGCLGVGCKEWRKCPGRSLPGTRA